MRVAKYRYTISSAAHRSKPTSLTAALRLLTELLGTGRKPKSEEVKPKEEEPEQELEPAPEPPSTIELPNGEVVLIEDATQATLDTYGRTGLSHRR